jgi:hypothetical protein
VNYEYLLETLPVQRIRPNLFLPFWLRTFRDASGSNLSVTPNNVEWQRAGQIDYILSPESAAIGYVDVAADSSLVTTDWTCFLFGDIQQHGNNVFMSRTLTGGPWFYLLTGFMALYDGSSFSLRSTNVIGAKSLAVSATAATAKPEFFVNGSSIGLGSVDITLDIQSSIWRLMGSGGTGMFNNPVGGIVQYGSVLTPDEHAAMNEWGASRMSPSLSPNRQHWDVGSWVPIQDPNDFGAWDFGIPTLGEYADRSGGGQTGVRVGSTATDATSVGPVLRNEAATDAVNAGTPVTSAADISIEALVRLKTAGGGGGGRLLNNVNMVIFFSGSPVDSFSWSMTGVTGSPWTGSSSEIVPDKWLHTVFTRRQSDGAIRVYVNGVEIYSATSGTEAFSPSGPMTLLNISGIRHLDGQVRFIRLRGRYMDAYEVNSRYHEIARKVLFYETWETARPTIVNATAGHVLDGTNWMVESGTWKISEDPAWKGPECVVAGKIVTHGVSDTDEWTITRFEQIAGTPNLTRGSDRLEIDGLAGDKVGEIILTQG